MDEELVEELVEDKTEPTKAADTPAKPQAAEPPRVSIPKTGGGAFPLALRRALGLE